MISVRQLHGEAIGAALEDVAKLRIAVFRDWPYLYEGSLEYERGYMQVYHDSSDTVLIGAFDGKRLVGAATGTPMLDHAEDFAAPLRQIDVPIGDIYYGAESVLLPEYRGQGIGHRFFDLREAWAKDFGATHFAFCSVIRPDDHPLKPEHARSNDAFWRKRGYLPIKGAIAQFKWRDIDESEESAKDLQFWILPL